MSTDFEGAAQAVLGEHERVIAAGVFGLRDSYKAIFVGGVLTEIATADLPGSAITDGFVTAASVHGSREVNARSKGVSVRMLVAVTDTKIRIFSLPSFGNRPERELMTFERSATTVEVKKFGASRHMTLRDSTGQDLGLTGSVAFFSKFAAGAKFVIAALA
ncbi:MAG: hypothetical protein P8J30_00625 [Ilumatobacter sp.]|nr:hypothetical protein [Ilumatobacter sp.]